MKFRPYTHQSEIFHSNDVAKRLIGGFRLKGWVVTTH